MMMKMPYTNTLMKQRPLSMNSPFNTSNYSSPYLGQNQNVVNRINNTPSINNSSNNRKNSECFQIENHMNNLQRNIYNSNNNTPLITREKKEEYINQFMSPKSMGPSTSFNLGNNFNMMNFNLNMNNNNLMNKPPFNNNFDFSFQSMPNMFNMFNLNNNMNNMNNILKSSTIVEKPLPHKIGLQNIGQTCYMNASLQCLTNINRISDNLLAMFNQNNISIQQQPLTYVYTSLLFEFKTTNQSYIIPQTFKATLEELNPLFQGNQASDAKDFIFFMIERLHQELKPPENPLNNFEQIDFLKQELEAKNQMLTLNKFLNEFNHNISIISKTFYGITRSIMKCEGCQNMKYSFQTFNILNLRVLESSHLRDVFLSDAFFNYRVLLLQVKYLIIVDAYMFYPIDILF